MNSRDMLLIYQRTRKLSVAINPAVASSDFLLQKKGSLILDKYCTQKANLAEIRARHSTVITPS